VTANNQRINGSSGAQRVPRASPQQLSAALGATSTDFYRRVYCILGLPFDAVTMEQAETLLQQSVKTRQRCFFSTPNLNFLVNALEDASFRDSVIRSDLSLADGMPIIWMARALGIPVQTRVAGSTLFERLREQAALPIRVFFFGGPEGVAQQAGTVLNAATNSSMICVGARSPGFGSIEEMSSDLLLDEINKARPDFLVVALGAKRGQAWIEHNLSRLETPVVSHLGAVVNFVAGTVSRAPARFGGLGLEWLWRIKEEPALWRRYWSDGKALLKLLFTRILPGALSAARAKGKPGSEPAPQLSLINENGRSRLTLAGNWHESQLAPLRDALTEMASRHSNVVLDLEKVTGLDSATLGLLLLLFGHQSKIGRGFTITALSPAVKRVLRHSCAEYLTAGSASDSGHVTADLTQFSNTLR
jgi:N-acetylglucosaminyldiphosphoundecaprenol N-acetyl-beta-D-mannosaminyltransferase